MGSLLVLLFDYEWVFSKDAVGVSLGAWPERLRLFAGKV